MSNICEDPHCAAGMSECDACKIDRLKAELGATQRELKDERARMCAWMDAFKTTQLSHAIERLEKAERDLAEARDDLACLRKNCYTHAELEAGIKHLVEVMWPSKIARDGGSREGGGR